MKYDVFISYSRKDFDEVSALLEKIRGEIPDISIWFDVDGIESGDDFEEKIISAIDSSSYILFALSDNSLDSQWTKAEVLYAGNTGKKVIPVLLKGAQLKKWFLFKFGSIDCIDSTNRLQMEKLCQNLSSWTARKPQVPLKEPSVSKFDALVDSFMGKKAEKKTDAKSRYDILTNDEGQVMLIIKSRENEPDKPLMFVSGNYDSLAILYRCKENAVYFDDLAEPAYQAISKSDEVWVVEMSPEGDMVREYKVPVRVVKDVKVFM